MAVKEGDKVTWKWGKGSATGEVKNVFTHKITRKIKGSEITKKGSSDNKALYITQDDGDRVLKLESEVSKDN